MGKRSNMNLEKLKTILGERVKKNEPMAHHTTFKIGGPADLFCDAKTTEELVRFILSARKLDVPAFILGGGSNILVGDGGIRGLVVKNSTEKIVIAGVKGAYKSGVQAGTVFVQADSGVEMNKLVRFTIEEGLAGLEAQLGLPGTVGGAMYMNSKWTHPVGYVGDCVYQATIITVKNEVKVVSQSYFNFGYDQSSLQTNGDIVLSVVFRLKQGNKKELWNVANQSMVYRHETQPQGIKSPGCTFRNVSTADALRVPTPNQTTSAGYLVDHAGLKGLSHGDAQISPVHANFIINRAKANASDVVYLIEQARKKVKEQFGVTLTEEIVRVGEF